MKRRVVEDDGDLGAEADARALSRFFVSQGRAMGITARALNDLVGR